MVWLPCHKLSFHFFFHFHFECDNYFRDVLFRSPTYFILFHRKTFVLGYFYRTKFIILSYLLFSAIFPTNYPLFFIFVLLDDDGRNKFCQYHSENIDTIEIHDKYQDGLKNICIIFKNQGDFDDTFAFLFDILQVYFLFSVQCIIRYEFWEDRKLCILRIILVESRKLQSIIDHPIG